MKGTTQSEARDRRDGCDPRDDRDHRDGRDYGDGGDHPENRDDRARRALPMFEPRWTRVSGEWMFSRESRAAMASGRTALVMVHGLAASGRYLLPAARRLALDFPVFVPDLPGFGRSHKPATALDIDELADRLTRWIDAIRIDRACLFGNSFGCQIVTALAVRDPDRVERLVLDGPTVDARRRTTARQMASFLADVPREPFGLVLVNARAYWRAGFRRTLQTYRYMMADAIEQRLPSVQAPTLVIRGERDPVVPQRWAEEIVRLLPRGRLTVIPAAAHATVYNSPDPLSRVVREFLLGDSAA